MLTWKVGKPGRFLRLCKARYVLPKFGMPTHVEIPMYIGVSKQHGGVPAINIGVLPNMNTMLPIVVECLLWLVEEGEGVSIGENKRKFHPMSRETISRTITHHNTQGFLTPALASRR